MNDNTDIIRQQLVAYNAGDIDGFVASFSDDVRVYRHPDRRLVLSTKAQAKHYYLRERAERPTARVEILPVYAKKNRIVVIERFLGAGEDQLELLMLYRLVNQQIVRIDEFKIQHDLGS